MRRTLLSALAGFAFLAPATPVLANGASRRCPSTAQIDNLRVQHITCGDARRAATEYLDSYAAYNAIGGGVVVFVTHHGSWHCSVVQPEAEGSIPQFSCRALHSATMFFAAPIEPLRSCPTFTDADETWVGGLVTRNDSCRELGAFVGHFPVYGPEYGGFPKPLTHLSTVWPSLLPNGHGPVPMRYSCTYRIPDRHIAEGWLCNDGYVAFGFQYIAVMREYEAAEAAPST